MPQRTHLADLHGRHFDVIVIGAGINGAAIARDAVRRGLSVALLDKGDISSGTTSWSTRLIHGGLRYLEHREFRLVRESLREREILLRNAPHLVKPLPLLLPIYADAKRGPLLVRTGMVLYDSLSYDKSLPRHRMLSAESVRKTAPSLDPNGLRGGALYYDAQIALAERLTVEIVLDAAESGVAVLPYTRAERILSEGAIVRGIAARDELTGEVAEIAGATVVNAAGPWVDEVLAGAPYGAVPGPFMGGTQGSHLVVDPFPGAPETALYYEAKSDGRAIFIVPWLGLYLIGTTDLRYDGDLDHVEASEEEIEYLLAETNRLMPGAGLNRDSVRYTYSGVRPLPRTDVGSTAAITRDHIIHDHSPRLRGLWSIIGGKLTTHRALAEVAVDQIARDFPQSRPCTTATEPMIGARGGSISGVRADCVSAGLAGPVIDRLLSHYGTRSRGILGLIAERPSRQREIDPVTHAIAAEVVFAVREEMVTTLSDLLLRRTMIAMGAHCGVGPDRKVAQIAGEELGWDDARIDAEVDAFRTYIARYHPQSLTMATP